MLSLRNISKEYHTGGETVKALNNVSLDFRTNEFVSILGPSGGGKTTLLNIIGGLDQYTSGDLIINGRSTKKYRDRDWDSYRNHSVGFVFQSYNLIPHQSVLQNVELALTLSGVSPSERKRRARKALEAVGLGDQIRKKPNEMSGGQMQRVAIARAIVNDPDIILADEPTGALDTQTSLQVMEILKDIAKDRLVVMVTHNPELAEKYSTRIVRLRDGQIIDDSNPLSPAETASEKEMEKAMGQKKEKKPSMSLLTSFGLSFKNLLSKKARTLLTSFAGSIGIIGIALIYAVSQGTSNYIDSIQQDTLSTYPLTITAETADMSSIMTAFGAMLNVKDDRPEGTLVEKQVMGQVFAQVGTNDLKSLKHYIDEHYDEIDDYVNEIKYSYGISPRVYTYDINGDVLRVNPTSIFAGYYSAFMGGSSVFSEMITNRELLDSQYDILMGSWPDSYDELVFVLSDRGTITDYMAYCLGLLDRAEVEEMMEKVQNSEEIVLREVPNEWTYEDIMDLDLRLVFTYQFYRYNSEFNVWENMSSDGAYVEDLVKNAERLKISGIVIPKEGVSASALSLGINYTPMLVDHIIAKSSLTDIVAAQLADPDRDIFSGKTFEELKNEEAPSMSFEDLITVDTQAISSAFGFDIKPEQLMALLRAYIGDIGSYISTSTKPAYDALYALVQTMAKDMIISYADTNTDEYGLCTLKSGDAQTYPDSYIAAQRAKDLYEQLIYDYDLEEADLTGVVLPILRDAMQLFMDEETQGQESVSFQREELDGRLPDHVKAIKEHIDQSVQIQSILVSLSARMTMNKMSEQMNSAIENMTTRLIASLPTAMGINVDGAKIASAFRFNMNQEDLQRLMNTYNGDTSSSSCDGNLRRLGYSKLDQPYQISVYMKDFTTKERFIEFLDNYNDMMQEQGLEDRVISYTDTTGLLMSSVKTIVDSVSYVLIAFVSISLIVSSIMIGVITLISVQERTKEIGILRAIGASKRNVSSMFNAETVMIGLTSGLVGIGITYLLCIPINKILYRLTDNANLKAVLPARVAFILVMISVTMTLISGIIPSKSAAKKDPVVALRTE